jgi:ABC-type sugar transport system ATPase subunit
MTPSSRTVLELADVSLRHRQARHFGLNRIELTLKPGECALLTVTHAVSCSSIGDLAQGLLEPDGGEVRFLGRPWTTLDGKTLAARRGLIGRVFAAHAWVSNLDVDENIVLAARHHLPASLETLQRQADDLARRLGLAEAPPWRPNQLGPHELKLAQWIRALLSPKTLLILENPLLDVHSSAMPALFEMLGDARRQGAAVLWLSSELTEYERRQVDPDWLLPVQETGMAD